MKRVFFSALTSVIAFCLYANGINSSVETCSNIRVFIGVEQSYREWHYSDASEPIPQNTFSGTIGMEHLQVSKVFWKLSLSHGSGSADGIWYDHETTTEGHIGYTFPISKLASTSLTPFMGMGYYYNYENAYEDLIKLRSTYIPVGFIFKWGINQKWEVGLHAQADLPLHNKFKIKNEKRKVTENTNWKLALPIKYSLDQRWDIKITPSYTLRPNINYRMRSGKMAEWGKISSISGCIELGYTL